MRDRELYAAIAAANPVAADRPARPAPPAGREALLEAVSAEPLPARPPAGRGPTRRLAPLLTLLLAVLAAATVFTTPGRAVTNWVGDRLGFGEPGGPPALRQLNEAWSKGSSLEGQPQYVLVVGPVTGRERSRYEFITYDPAPHPEHPRWPDGPCFKLDLTQVRSMTSQGCGVLPKGRQFAYLGGGGGYGHAYVDEGTIRFADELFHFSGRVGPEVASVEATLNGREIPVQVRPVPEDLRERFGLGGPFSFFVGFYSGVAHGGTLEVTARGADGERLGHAKTELFSLIRTRRFSCRQILESGDHIPRPGREECEELLGLNGNEQ